jgi:type VI secretion system protein VasD
MYRLLAVAGTFGLLACSSTPSPAPKEPEKCKQQIVSSAVISSPHINPTVDGEPRPVQLRLYQLKTDTKFLNASFEQIWNDDKTALGDSLGKVEEFTVYPNTRTEVKFERDESAQFLVAAGLFREPKGRSWHVSFELPPPPSAGSCGAKCTGPECDAGTANANPKLYVWVDGTSVQDGSNHADDYPEGRVHAAGVSTPSDCAGAPKEEPPPPTEKSGSSFDPSNLSADDLKAPEAPKADVPKAEAPKADVPKGPTKPQAPSL